MEAIKTFPQPITVGQLQTYMGRINFYRRFLRGAAGILKPLTDVLKGGPRGVLPWTAEMKQAFAVSKQAVYNAVEFAHPAEHAEEISLAVD